MFFIDKITHSVFPKPEETDNEIIRLGSFYSQTLHVITKYINLVCGTSENAFSSLQRYIEIVENAKEDSPVYRSIQNYRMNLIDDLRVIIISMLCGNDTKHRKLLKSYHSILHLISLKSKKTLSAYHIMNEWLNSNNYLNDDEMKLHALRGNLGKLIRAYPQLRESIEELCTLENHFRTSKIDNDEYIYVKNRWIKNYKEIIPIEIRDILTCSYNQSTEHWTEILCYKLCYGNNKCLFDDSIKELDCFIDDNDEVFLVLTERYDKLIDVSFGWIKLILNFVFKHNSRINFYDTINQIATRLYDVDWQLSLDFFSFTTYSSYYFNQISTTIDLNPIIFDFLNRYAVRNKLDASIIHKRYTYILLQEENYFLLFKFINDTGFFDIKYNHRFVNYILSNIDNLLPICTEEFKKTEVGGYINLYKKIIDNQEEPNKTEIDLLFSSRWTMYNIKPLIKSVVTSKRGNEVIIMKCLDFLLCNKSNLEMNDDELV